MDDYPNQSDSWYPETPEERKEKENKEQVKVSSSIGVVQDVLDWFEANAKLYASVDSLGIDESTSDADAKLAVLLSKKMRATFLSKAESFRGEFKKYLKEAEQK